MRIVILSVLNLVHHDIFLLPGSLVFLFSCNFEALVFIERDGSCVFPVNV